jgi:hypothetical protein
MLGKADGSIRIDTRIDTGDVEKDMSQLRQSFEKTKKFFESMFNKSSVGQQAKEVNSLGNTYDNLVTKLDTTNARIDVQRQKLAALREQLDRVGNGPKNSDQALAINEKIALTEASINRLATTSDKTAEEINKIESSLGGVSQEGKKLKETDKNVDNIGKNVNKGSKRLLGYTGALFGVYSAYRLVSRAASAWLNSDDGKQTKANIDYMIFALGTVFAPLVKTIVGWFFQLLQLINSISIALFNFNLFSKATLKNFQGIAKSAASTKKSLATFDEKNVLPSPGGSSTVAPNIDLSQMLNADNAEVQANKIKDYLKSVNDYWDNLKFDTKGNWGMFIDGLLFSLKSVWDLVESFVDLFEGVFYTIKFLFTGNLEDLQKASDAFMRFWGHIFEFIVDLLSGIFGILVGFVKGLFSDLLQGLWNLVTDISDKVNNAFAGLVYGIGDFFKNMWEGVKNTTKKAWDWILGLFGKGGQIFNGITDAIGNVFKTIVNGIIEGLNFIIKQPFNFINGLLNKIKDLSFLGIAPFKNLWGYNPLPVPQIPKLARGGIVNRPTQAIIGEAGPERVIPLSEDTEWIEKVAEAFAKKISVNGNGDIIVEVYLDGNVIQRKFYQKNNRNSFERNEGKVF